MSQNALYSAAGRRTHGVTIDSAANKSRHRPQFRRLAATGGTARGLGAMGARYFYAGSRIRHIPDQADAVEALPGPIPKAASLGKDAQRYLLEALSRIFGGCLLAPERRVHQGSVHHLRACTVGEDCSLARGRMIIEERRRRGSRAGLRSPPPPSPALPSRYEGGIPSRSGWQEVSICQQVSCHEVELADYAEHATEQLTTTPRTQSPTAPDTTTESRATGATAAAIPTGRSPKQTQPDPQVVAVHRWRQLSQLALEKASASAWPGTEQPDELIETVTAQHRPDAGVVRTQADAEITQNTTEPPTQKGPDHIGATKSQTEVSCDADTGTTRHATEQSHTDEHEAPELNGPGQQMAYVIVNAFLVNVTFWSTEAEILTKQVIRRTDEVFRPNMLLNIDEVFRPIFFYYPNGLHDRTRGEPRNARQYIRQWRDIAAWRQLEGAGAEQHATEQLEHPQVQSIFHQYIDNFIHNKALDRQRAQPWNKNKSRAEAVLRRLCGSTMMAKVIWQVGLPNISEATCAITKFLPATEQQRPLKQDVRDSIATATQTILNWVSMVANSVQEHKATSTYQEHARKSGTQKNKSGLTEEELSMKAEKKRAARLRYGRQPSTASGSHTWQAPAQWQGHGDTWQAPAQWQWHGDTWQAPAQYQWQRHGH